jgi:lysophospholipase L1-like esterase
MRIALVALALVAVPAFLAPGAGSARSDALASRTVPDVGDSLSVGAAPYLRATLRGYRIEQDYDVGLHSYDAAHIVSATRPLPSVLVVSAGTNDDPRIVSTFAHAVSTIVTVAGPRRCVVWPTIVRPPAVGATYEGINRALARAAAHDRNLVLVDWVRVVAAHRWWLAEDGVHVSSVGYRARAAAIASAVATRCP